MTSPIDITPQMLSDAAGNCTSTAGTIDTELGILRSNVYALGEVYLGVASAQFQALMTDYDAYARMLHDALGGIADGLRGNFHNYTTSEESNAANLVAISGTIPGARI